MDDSFESATIKGHPSKLTVQRLPDDYKDVDVERLQGEIESMIRDPRIQYLIKNEDDIHRMLDSTLEGKVILTERSVRRTLPDFSNDSHGLYWKLVESVFYYGKGLRVTSDLSESVFLRLTVHEFGNLFAITQSELQFYGELRKQEEGRLERTQVTRAHANFIATVFSAINTYGQLRKIVEKNIKGYPNLQRIHHGFIDEYVPIVIAPQWNFGFNEGRDGFAPLDAWELAMVLREVLIVNPLKYTRAAHKPVIESLKRQGVVRAVGQVEVTYHLEDYHIVFQVKDNGLGLGNQKTEDLFQNGSRGRLAVQRKTSGTGRGLFIARQIIEKHPGGRISLMNRNDLVGGAIGIIVLPLNLFRFPGES